MKITFLGTGAADWPLTNTTNSPEFRRLSSAIINTDLLIDPGPQVPEALETCGFDPAGVKYILNTHRHDDHFCPQTVERLEGFGARPVELSAGETTTIGDYTVYAYSGNHGTCPGTVHFLITDGRHTVFYGLDGAWLLYDEVQAIQTHRPDLAVLEATVGFIDSDYRIFEHNNLYMVLEMQKTLAPFVGRLCISHMARTLHTDHATLEQAMAPHHILVARDGLEIDLDK